MGAGESGVTEIQAQIDDAVQEQIQQAISEAVPQTEKKENSQQVEFVKVSKVFDNLRETCKILDKHDKQLAATSTTEEYQINNSDEISGFNLKMK